MNRGFERPQGPHRRRLLSALRTSARPPVAAIQNWNTAHLLARPAGLADLPLMVEVLVLDAESRQASGPRWL